MRKWIDGNRRRIQAIERENAEYERRLSLRNSRMSRGSLDDGAVPVVAVRCAFRDVGRHHPHPKTELEPRTTMAFIKNLNYNSPLRRRMDRFRRSRSFFLLARSRLRFSRSCALPLWAFKLVGPGRFFPSSCFGACHSRCCFVRSAFVTLVCGPRAGDATPFCDVVQPRTPSMRRYLLPPSLGGGDSPATAMRRCRPHAFWCARAWFMMCCAWCSRAWGCAAACTSRAASQKPMRGCPSAAKGRRRRRRKSRTGSMAAAAPRRC